MANHRSTIQDVARMSGVSTATVSRVINQNGRFSTETEMRVRDAIDRLGYVPNLTAKVLRTQRSGLVGILVSRLSYEYVNRIVTTLQQRLFEQGFIGIVCNLSENYENELTYLDAMFSMNICALIVFSSGRPIRRPEDRTIPVIYINRTPEDLNDPYCCAIETDSVSAGYKACTALIEAGCRRVAIVRTFRGLEVHGLRVPEDVKVVGCNDMSVAMYNNRPITTIRHQTEAICLKAIENMKRLLNGEALEQRHTLFDVELVRRQTL